MDIGGNPGIKKNLVNIRPGQTEERCMDIGGNPGIKKNLVNIRPGLNGGQMQTFRSGMKRVRKAKIRKNLAGLQSDPS